MGRQKKQGLSYCHLDVDFLSDIKVRKLIRKFGASASAVYTATICQVFTRGYFVQASGIAYIIAESLCLEEQFVLDVINYAAQLELFDREMLRNSGIITSVSIQRRYVDQCKGMRRNVDISDMQYCLLEQKEKNTKTKKQPLQRDIFSSEEKTISSDLFGKNGINSEEKPISSEEIGVSSEEKAILQKKNVSVENSAKNIISEKKNISSEEKNENAKENISNPQNINDLQREQIISSEDINISSEETTLKNISSEEKNISSEDILEEKKQKKEKEPKRIKEKNKKDKEQKQKNTREENEKQKNEYVEGLAQIGEDDWHEHNYKRFLMCFNSYLKANHSVIKPVSNLTNERRSKLDRLFQYPRDKINILLYKIAVSPFLNARDKRLKRPADFDWIFREENIVKILEGNFD